MPARINNKAERAPNRAPDQKPTPGVDGWIKPKHGQGFLRPFQPGNSGRPPNVSTRYTETLRLARAASPDAMQTLIARLADPDGRIAVVAANSILERAWGKVKEAKPEEQQQASIDLSQLRGPELALLLKLVESGRLVAAAPDPGDVPEGGEGGDAGPAQIEATAEPDGS